jgi:signal recognition particle GTPase
LLGLGAATETNADQVLAALENSLIQGDISAQTHDTILNQMNDPQVTGRVLDDKARAPNTGVIAGLIMGSPEFQKR